MPPLEDAPMNKDIEEGLEFDTEEMDIDGIYLQSIMEVVYRQDMQAIPPEEFQRIKKSLHKW
jgi:hypothetical protein